MILDRDSFGGLCFCISNSKQQTWFPKHSDLQWTWAQSVPTVADVNPTTGNRQAHVQGTEEYGKSMPAVLFYPTKESSNKDNCVCSIFRIRRDT